MNYSDICKKCKCEEFIIWEFQKGDKLESCKIIGQSDIVDVIPLECPYIKEFIKIGWSEDMEKTK